MNKHNYFLPMSWIVMPLLGKDLAFQINLDKAGTRSLMERFGLKRTGGDTGGSGVCACCWRLRPTRLGRHGQRGHRGQAGVAVPRQAGRLVC